MNAEIARVLGDEIPTRQRSRAGAKTIPAYAATPAE